MRGVSVCAGPLDSIVPAMKCEISPHTLSVIGETRWSLIVSHRFARNYWGGHALRGTAHAPSCRALVPSGCKKVIIQSCSGRTRPGMDNHVTLGVHCALADKQPRPAAPRSRPPLNLPPPSTPLVPTPPTRTQPRGPRVTIACRVLLPVLILCFPLFQVGTRD